MSNLYQARIHIPGLGEVSIEEVKAAWKAYVEREMKKNKKKIECIGCGRDMRQNPHSLTMKYKLFMVEVAEWCYKNGTNGVFNPYVIFENRPNREYKQKTADFPTVCHYLGLLDMVFWKDTGKRKIRHWQISRDGYLWLAGRIAMPEKVGVFDKKIQWTDDKTIFIHQVDKDWKTQYDHYLMDYIPQQYRLPVPDSAVRQMGMDL